MSLTPVLDRARNKPLPDSPWYVTSFPITSSADWQALTNSVFPYAGAIPHLWWSPFPSTASFPVPFQDETRSANIIQDASKPWFHPMMFFILLSALFWILWVWKGGHFSFDYSVISWRFITLLRGSENQPNRALTCIWSSNYFSQHMHHCIYLHWTRWLRRNCQVMQPLGNVVTSQNVTLQPPQMWNIRFVFAHFTNNCKDPVFFDYV